MYNTVSYPKQCIAAYPPAMRSEAIGQDIVQILRRSDVSILIDGRSAAEHQNVPRRPLASDYARIEAAISFDMTPRSTNRCKLVSTPESFCWSVSIWFPRFAK